MVAYAQTPSGLTWLRVNHLINGLHKQISCKNCLYAVNSYFTLASYLTVTSYILPKLYTNIIDSYSYSDIDW